MTFTPLFSSSHGNAYLVAHSGGRLLLECSVPFKRLQAAAGFTLSRLDGCLITHEHKDHALAWETLAKNGVPLLATEGTARTLASGPGWRANTGPFRVLDGTEAAGVRRYDRVEIGGMAVRPFQVYHDAAEPVGFLLRSLRDGERLVFFADTVNVGWTFPPCEIAAVECNYAPALLARAERLPERVKDRIARTHMSIERSVRFLAALDQSRLREVYLLHLSDATGSAYEFQRAAKRVCGPGVKVTVCPREP